MEIGGREAIQAITLIMSLVGAFVTVKSQLGRAMIDLKKAADEIEAIKEIINENRRKDMAELYTKLHSQDARIDSVEATEAVVKNQITTMRSILSPDGLAKREREIATLICDVSQLKMAADRIYHMHNGSHPK